MKKLVSVILITCMVFVPICLNYIFVNLSELLLRIYSPLYNFRHFLFYIVYLLVGIVLGLITSRKLSTNSGDKKCSVMNFVLAGVSLILTVLFNSYFTVLWLKNNYDPYFIWVICVGFMVSTAFINVKKPAINLIYLCSLILLPVWSYYIRVLFPNTQAVIAYYVHAVYFLVVIIFSIPVLQFELSKQGKIQFDIPRVTTGCLFVLLALVFNNYNSSFVMLDAFYLWTIFAGYMFTSSVKKLESNTYRRQK